MKLTKIEEQKIDEILNNIIEGNEKMLGYPVSKDFDYSRLNEFLKHPINNVGDPYEESTNKIDTHEMEREVVGFFAKLFNFSN